VPDVARRGRPRHPLHHHEPVHGDARGVRQPGRDDGRGGDALSRDRVAALGAELARIHDALREDLGRLRSGEGPPGTPFAAHCLAFCAALTRHHTGEEAGAFPALAGQFPDLRPLLEKMAEDHVLIAGIVARVEAAAADGAPGELDGLAAILESHFSFEERRLREALDELDGSPDLLGG
jgi:hypothetical protein